MGHQAEMKLLPTLHDYEENIGTPRAPNMGQYADNYFLTSTNNSTLAL